MERITFLSHVLQESTPTYGNKGRIALRPVRRMTKGDVCNEMHWSLGNHSGTHVDAPFHFVRKGPTLDQYAPLDWVFARVALVDVPSCAAGGMIMPEVLGRLRRDTDLLLLRTGFERFRGRTAYWKDAPGVHPDMAAALKEKCPGIRALGMDIISVSSSRERELGRAAHRAFLGRGILLVEDMKLSGLKRAPRQVVVAPVNVKGADAAPCTVFAWERP